jgi:hypothetical protein
MSPPLLVLSGAPPPELKSVIVNSKMDSPPPIGTAVRNRTEDAVGVSPILMKFDPRVVPS